MELAPTLDLDKQELKLWYEFGDFSYECLKYCESIVLKNPHIFE